MLSRVERLSSINGRAARRLTEGQLHLVQIGVAAGVVPLARHRVEREAVLSPPVKVSRGGEGCPIGRHPQVSLALAVGEPVGMRSTAPLASAHALAGPVGLLLLGVPQGTRDRRMGAEEAVLRCALVQVGCSRQRVPRGAAHVRCGRSEPPPLRPALQAQTPAACLQRRRGGYLLLLLLRAMKPCLLSRGCGSQLAGPWLS
jgi:hypothetical protein